jgi:phosphate transport system substrate-binding protein
MPPILRLLPATLVAAALAALCTTVNAETRPTIFCLLDGTKIGAARFETRDGKFLLYVNGASEPLEYAANAIRGINVDPCPAPPPALAPISTAATANGPMSSGRFGVEGSNTIGERLMPMLIEAFARKAGAKPSVKLTEKEEEEISFEASGARALIDLKAHGSGTAAKALVEGRAAIGMASRRLKAEELKAVDEKFHVDALAAGNEHVLALDGLAIIVNAANPVQKLDLSQIADVFAGRVANWSALGGADRPIKVLRRDDNSGTFDTFKSLVLAPFKLEIAPQLREFESSEALSEEVARDVDAIGFVATPYVNRNAAVAVGSSCGIVGKLSKFSIKTEEYPLSRRLFLYTIGAPVDPVARDLLHFALSDDAQPTIEEAEFVEQSVVFQNESEQRQWASAFASDPRRGLPPGKVVPADAITDFTKLTDATRRSSIVLRFKEGSAELDNRAIQDVSRIARFLKTPGLEAKPIYAVGFADANGDWRDNSSLARRRAQRVAEALARAGLHVPAQRVKSFSFLAPSACNDSDAGAAKNRRVEIWVGN